MVKPYVLALESVNLSLQYLIFFMFVFLEFCSCPICKLFLVIFIWHFSQSSKNLSVEAQNLSSKKELLGQKFCSLAICKSEKGHYI